MPADAAPGAARSDAPAPKASKLDHALAFAARGLAVFPLQENAKTPLPGTRGHLDATTDPEAIRRAWSCPLTGAIMPYNVGASPRDGRTVIVDLDVKEGRDGINAYLALGGELTGLVISTPSGGRHIYCAGEDIRTSAGRLAAGVDLRGADGYAVAPGSTIDGVAYKIVEDGPIQPLPAFVAEKVGTRTDRDRARLVTSFAVDPDRFANVRRAIRVAKAAEPACGGMWHDLGFRLGAEMARIGLSGDMAVRVLERHWQPRGTGFKSRDRFVRDVLGGHEAAVRDGDHGRHAVPDVRALFDGFPVTPPPPEAATTPGAEGGEATDPPMYAGWRRVCSTSLAGKPIPPREWLVDQWLSPGHVTVLFGEGGTGKSILMQQLMLACATGRDWLGLQTTSCSTFDLFCEDSEEELHRRQAGLCRLLGVDLADTGRMSWVSGADTENELVVFDRNGRMELTPQFRRLLHETEDTGARLITVDTGACTFGGDENIRRQVTPFVRVALGRVARATNAAVVLTLHPSRSGINRGDPDGGSTAWTGSARARWTLSRARGEMGAVDPAERVLALPKSNYSVDCAELRMRRVSEGFVPVVPLTVAETRARDVQAEAVFLKLLNRWSLQGRNLSPHSRASTYAAKVLATQPDREGLLRSDFEGAMDRLFREGRLMTEMWGPPSNRKQRVVPTPGR